MTSLTFYDAKYYRASPTWNIWVKCTASFVHSLVSEPGFYGQSLRTFHLNHPLRYLCLTGPIVSIDDISARYTILTLDDGSGATIEVKIPRVVKDNPNYGAVSTEKFVATEETSVQGLRVRSWALGEFRVLLGEGKDGVELNVGSVVKVKGTLDEWRGVRQIELKRIFLVRSTNEEVAAWKDIAAHARILSKPWVLSKEDMRRIDAEDEEERRKVERAKRKEKEKEARREEKRRARAEKVKVREEREEVRRKKLERMLDDGAIDKKKW